MKYTPIVMMAVLMLALAPATLAVADIGSATAAWTFDNSTFNTTHYTDASGNGYDLVLDPNVTTATFGTPGYVNEAFVTVSTDGSAFEKIPFDLQQSWSMCGYQNITSLSGGDYLIGSNYGGTSGSGFDVYQFNTEYVAYFYDGAGNDIEFHFPSLTQNVGTYVCVAVDEATNNVSMWYDGVLQTQTVSYNNGWDASLQNYTDGNEYFVGAYTRESEAGNSLDGTIDEVIIYNGEVLTTSDASTIYSNLESSLQYPFVVQTEFNVSDCNTELQSNRVYNILANFSFDSDTDPVFGSSCFEILGLHNVTINGPAGVVLSDDTTAPGSQEFLGILDDVNISSDITIRNIQIDGTWADIATQGKSATFENNVFETFVWQTTDELGVVTFINNTFEEQGSDFADVFWFEGGDYDTDAIFINNTFIAASSGFDNNVAAYFEQNGATEPMNLTGNYFLNTNGSAFSIGASAVTSTYDFYFTNNIVNETAHTNNWYNSTISNFAVISGNIWTSPTGTGHSDTCTNDGSGVCVEQFTVFVDPAVNDTAPVALTASAPTEVNITGCIDLVSNTNYYFQSDLALDGSTGSTGSTYACILGNGVTNVTIDGQGFTINETNGGQSYSLFAFFNSNDITVQNVNTDDQWYSFASSEYGLSGLVDDITFINNTGTGIQFDSGVTNLVMDNNNMTWPASAGYDYPTILLYGSGSGQYVENITLTNNYIANNYASAASPALDVFANALGVDFVYDFYFDNNTFRQTNNVAALDFGGSSGSALVNITFTNNDVYQPVPPTAPAGRYTYNNTIMHNTWRFVNGSGFSETCTNDGSGYCTEEYAEALGPTYTDGFWGTNDVNDTQPIALTASEDFLLDACQVISSAGDYNVTQNISFTTGTCLEVTVDGVTINGFDYEITTTAGGKPVDVQANNFYMYDATIEATGSNPNDLITVSGNNAEFNNVVFTMPSVRYGYVAQVSGAGFYLHDSVVTNCYEGYGVRVTGDDAVIENNLFQNSPVCGSSKQILSYIAGSNVDNLTVEGNNFTGGSGSWSGYEAIEFSGTNTNVLVNNNRFEAVVNHDVETISGTTSGTFTNNYFDGPVSVSGTSTFYENTFNSTATHSFTSVSLDNGSIGNYWANPTETGYSETCLSLDGVTCESAYVNGGATDNYPQTNNGAYDLFRCAQVTNTGTWTVSQALSGVSTNGACIDVATSGVTIDNTGGHTVTATSTSSVRIAGANAVVRGGTYTGDGFRIYAGDLEVHGATISVASGTPPMNVKVITSGMVLNETVLFGSSVNAFEVDFGREISDLQIINSNISTNKNNGYALLLYGADNTVIEDSRIFSGLSGQYVTRMQVTGDNMTIRNNDISDSGNGRGMVLVDVTNSEVYGNTIDADVIGLQIAGTANSVDVYNNNVTSIGSALTINTGTPTLYDNVITGSTNILASANLNMSTTGNTWTTATSDGYSDTCVTLDGVTCLYAYDLGNATDYYPYSLNSVLSAIVNFNAYDEYLAAGVNTFCAYDTTNASEQWCTTNGTATTILVRDTYDFKLNATGMYEVEENFIVGEQAQIFVPTYTTGTIRFGSDIWFAQEFVAEGDKLVALKNPSNQAGTVDYEIREGHGLTGDVVATVLGMSNLETRAVDIALTDGADYTILSINAGAGEYDAVAYSRDSDGGRTDYAGGCGYMNTGSYGTPRCDRDINFEFTFNGTLPSDVNLTSKEYVAVSNVLVDNQASPSAVWNETTSQVNVSWTHNGINTATEVDYGTGSMVVYNASSALVPTNNLVVGENTFTITTNETYDVFESQDADASNPMNVSKLAAPTNIAPNSGQVTQTLFNATWDAAAGGVGTTTYDTIVDIAGTNYSLDTATANLFSEVNTTLEGVSKVYVRANDDYFTTDYVVGGDFEIVFEIGLSSFACPSVLPNEENLPQAAQFEVEFDADLAVGFTTTTLDMTVEQGAESVVLDETDCSYVQNSPTSRTYTCNASMNYWFAPGAYDVNVTVYDAADETNQVEATLCTYGTLIASKRTVDTITFPGSAPGTTDVAGTPAMNMENTGNVDLDLYMTAQDLTGRTNPAATLLATNFKAGASLGTAVGMEDSVQKDLNMQMTRGSGSNEDVWLWLSMPSNQDPQEYFTPDTWEIHATG